ncbi:hypothetical protein DAPPUDRAFT_316183 [Daphnia pulex]|uniref:Uncharacterized protein n=1 Tax=Daphnia pulex TaxID=6669 RepID=E9GBZ8_DAPPU|nr:hypothetical protein DAPPUDRAFT_316183 [Daphnia pulex]|eukprot:EFX83067.1 hypothetical protein DAPPUDRAFT_316183 [Daphnia pulex]
MNCSEIDQAAEAAKVIAELCEGQDCLEEMIEEIVAALKTDKRFWKIRAMLSEVRKAFDSIKKLYSECLEEHLHFEKKLVHYLREETTESTTIDAVCTWIEIEFSKSKVSFLPALVSAVMRSSFFKSTEVFRMSKGISLLNFVTFRRWAPLLHRYFTEVDVAACQILIFLIQDFLSSSHQKYPKDALTFNEVTSIFHLVKPSGSNNAMQKTKAAWQK